MASPQFHAFLQRLVATGQQQPLRWEPVRRSSYTAYCDFYLALGQGVLRLASNEDDPQTRPVRYAATLYTREGLIVDEWEITPTDDAASPLLCELYRQARSAAFKLPELLAEMETDLAAGQTREIPQAVLPSQSFSDSDNGFGNEFSNPFLEDNDDLDIPF